MDSNGGNPDDRAESSSGSSSGGSTTPAAVASTTTTASATAATGGADVDAGAPPTPSWWTDWERLRSEITQTQDAPTAVPLAVMRSAQLDAQRLDEELKNLLTEQLHRAFKAVNQDVLGSLRLEASALLDLAVFWLTVWRGKPTPGMRLMNLRFRDETSGGGGGGGGGSRSSGKALGGSSGVEGPPLSFRQRLALGLLLVGGRYAWARLHGAAAARRWRDAPEGSWQRRAWRALAVADDAMHLAHLANFLLFLRSGKYRTLPERLVKARLVYDQASAQRAVSFDFLNRQLVWQELSELILTVLPIINPEKIRSLAMRWSPSFLSSSSAAPEGREGHDLGPSGESMEASTTRGPKGCICCGVEDIVTPYFALPCCHVFCYYCLRSRTESDRHFSCPRCGQRVDAMRRVNHQHTSAFPAHGGAGNGNGASNGHSSAVDAGK